MSLARVGNPRHLLLLAALWVLGAGKPALADSVWVSRLDISKTQQDWGHANADRSVEGHPIRIGGECFAHGVGTHAASLLCVNLAGYSTRLTAAVGIDDEVKDRSDPVEFHIFGDGKLLWKSKPLTTGTPAETVDLDLKNVKLLTLGVEPAGEGIQSCHADWADAKIDFEGQAPATVDAPKPPSHILTPPAGPEPRINGPRVFGVRPGHPVFYTIPVSGERPMTFAVDNLPPGLELDAKTGRLSGTLAAAGEFPVILRATNARGSTASKFKIVAGEQIALTPPMGWNSWNCWGGNVDQNKILRSARAMAASELINHGWTYVNIDDAWQGGRGGALNAIQPDPKRFPDIKGMCEQIHAMGLKTGIYSTPWVTSYAGRVGGSSEDEHGAWDRSMTKGPKNQKVLPFAIGRHHFFRQDALQWAAWGIDYLKFDWGPNEEPETREMGDALRGSGRDIVLSLSNNTAHNLFAVIPRISRIANCWRIGDDITDTWKSVVSHGFNHDEWAPYASPGHWNDPDMMEVGANGGGAPKRLKPDEQYTHMSLWCLLSAPLLLGCDLDHLDEFTVSLLTNDEVLAIDQDSLGRQGIAVAKRGQTQVYAKDLEDGSKAVGLFNLGSEPADCAVEWSELNLHGIWCVRDLWRQRDLGSFSTRFQASVPAHGVMLVRISPTVKMSQ